MTSISCMSQHFSWLTSYGLASLFSRMPGGIGSAQWWTWTQRWRCHGVQGQGCVWKRAHVLRLCRLQGECLAHVPPSLAVKQGTPSANHPYASATVSSMVYNTYRDLDSLVQRSMCVYMYVYVCGVLSWPLRYIHMCVWGALSWLLWYTHVCVCGGLSWALWCIHVCMLRYIHVCTGRDTQRASCRAHAPALLLACVCLVLTPSDGAQGGLRRRFDRGYVRHRHSAWRATVHGLPPVPCPASHVYVLCGVIGNKMWCINMSCIIMSCITRPCVSVNLHPCLATCTHASHIAPMPRPTRVCCTSKRLFKCGCGAGGNCTMDTWSGTIIQDGNTLPTRLPALCDWCPSCSLWLVSLVFVYRLPLFCLSCPPLVH